MVQKQVLKNPSLSQLEELGVAIADLLPGDNLSCESIQYTPDVLTMKLFSPRGPLVGLSTLFLLPRKKVVDVTERHHLHDEIFFAVDGAMDVHVWTGEKYDPDNVVILRVKKGQGVLLRAGVGHHAPFAVKKKGVNVVIVALAGLADKDCDMVDLDPGQQVVFAKPKKEKKSNKKGKKKGKKKQPPAAMKRAK